MKHIKICTTNNQIMASQTSNNALSKANIQWVENTHTRASKYTKYTTKMDRHMGKTQHISRNPIEKNQ